MDIKLPKSVIIVEVGPRDGLQNEAVEVSTDQKVDLVNCLSQTGLTRIEVTSFTHPSWIPQLKDAESLMNGIQRKEGVVYSALVPNKKGFERAMGCRVDELVLLVSASEKHNMKNVNRNVHESLKELKETSLKIPKDMVRIRGVIAMAFECPFEGKISIDRVIDIGKELISMGVYEIALADTAGLANPAQVFEVFSRVSHELLGISLAAHFHNTYGFGLANVFASLQCGVNVFDGSIGGLGGCPYIPDASGNIATEDLVYMMEKMGIETGIELSRLMKCSKLTERFVQKPLTSYLSKQKRMN
ncbi:MAG: hydroxymethylglutaryl-CoA lyase [Pseudomonadota bacterium]